MNKSTGQAIRERMIQSGDDAIKNAALHLTEDQILTIARLFRDEQSKAIQED